MNTKQKLTLGIAAIFMVTLTIIGVTYAYFVTRVTGDTTESVDIRTATIGNVEYQTGNGTTDNVVLEDVLPGQATLYKSFRVYNNSEGAGADYKATFNVYMTSHPTADAAHFVHATSDAGCYVSAVKPSNDAAPTTTCFDGTAYNNVYVTLYEVNQTVYETVQNDGTITDDSALTTPVYNEAHVSALAGATVVDVANQDMVTDVNIDGQATKYYVAKIEYKNNNLNQNIENDAALTLKFSIK